jgi:transcription antitermination factor NusB
VLFQDDLNPGLNPAEADAFLERRLRGGDPSSIPPFATSAPTFVAAPETAVNPRVNPFADPTPAGTRPAPTAGQASLIEFARSLVAGVRRNRGELDALLGQTADNWRIERMAATDRNVLRLGAFELLFTDIPGPVAINEAVELAKRYGTAQSAQFVNGILDKLLSSHRKG